ALWSIPERQQKLLPAVQAMLADDRPEWQQAGLLVVARAGLEALRDRAASLLPSAELRTRYLAGLAYLGAGGADGSQADAALAPVLAVLSEVNVPEAAREEVASL